MLAEIRNGMPALNGVSKTAKMTTSVVISPCQHSPAAEDLAITVADDSVLRKGLFPVSREEANAAAVILNLSR